MINLSVDVNPKVNRHFNVSIDKGKFSLDVFSVEKIDGQKDPKLTPINSISIDTTSAKDGIELLKHIRWEIGQVLDLVKQREQEIGKALSDGAPEQKADGAVVEAVAEVVEEAQPAEMSDEDLETATRP